MDHVLKCRFHRDRPCPLCLELEGSFLSAQGGLPSTADVSSGFIRKTKGRVLLDRANSSHKREGTGADCTESQRKSQAMTWAGLWAWETYAPRQRASLSAPGPSTETLKAAESPSFKLQTNHASFRFHQEPHTNKEHTKRVGPWSHLS